MKYFMIAAFMAVVFLSALFVEGSPDGMNNLTVDLGFNQFPAVYTCSGMNVSPQINISGLTGMSNVTSAAMTMQDPDAPNGTFIHWVIWNLPPVDVIPGDIPNEANVTEPIAAVQGSNGIGMIGYIGPCPPPGNPHRYFLRVYGLDNMLNLTPGSNISELEKAMEGHIVLQGEAMATFGR